MRHNQTTLHVDVLIVGGGPSGSSAAIALAAGGMNVAVVEKKRFPREVLCGEFLSHEVTNAIKSFGLYDEFLRLRPNSIRTFRFIPESGSPAVQSLGFEAWSLKRSLLDQMLLEKAASVGASVIQPCEVVSILRSGDVYTFQCRTPDGDRMITADAVIAAYGKQNALDRSLGRSHTAFRSGLNGIKYHLPVGMIRDCPAEEIHIYASDGIYCGVNRVSESEETLCFLASGGERNSHPREALQQLLLRNTSFRDLFLDRVPDEMWRLPFYGTGNIYFGRKEIVREGIYMIGDAAAVIAPLAGDGIGMAIESGQLIARVFLLAREKGLSEQQREMLYVREWGQLFNNRLRVASCLQTIALRSPGGNLGGLLLRKLPGFSRNVIRWTRSVSSAFR